LRLKVYQVDSFTTALFEGNPAGVVLNGEGLSPKRMQQIARELNNSETAFLFDEPGEGYDVEVRFFTPTREVPVCGHATVAAHYVYARERGMGSGRIRQKTGAGILPVDIEEEEGDLRIVMTQGKVEFGDLLEGENRDRLMRGLNIGEEDLREDLPLQIVSTGHSKVMVPLRSAGRLNGLVTDGPALSALSAVIGCNGYYAFTLDSGEEGVLASGRMFAPAIGIPEDPVTGNANGPLGAYLTEYGLLPRCPGGLSFRIKQGEAIGRKGYMDVRVCAGEGGIGPVQISGRAVIAFETEMGWQE